MNLEYFLEIEKKYNLLDAKIEDYNIWLYARFRIGWMFAKNLKHFGEGHSEKRKTGLVKVRECANTLKNIFLYGDMRKLKPANVLILNHPRRVLNGSLYECVYTDELASELNDYIMIEGSYQKTHFRPVKTEKIFYSDLVEIESFWYCVFIQKLKKKRFRMIKEKIQEILEKPLLELNYMLGTDVEVDKVVTEVTYGFFMYKIERKYYEKIIKKISPKLVIEVVSYSRNCQIINEIANSYDIPTIELQHGVMGCEHIAYNYSEKKYLKQFPKYIFTFSDYWISASKFPIPLEQIKAVGYPYLEKMFKKYNNFAKVERNKKVVLFLSSGPMGEELGNIAVFLQKLLGEEYHIVFKLHPGEYADWKDRYPILVNEKIEVIDNNRINLYELFSMSDFQVCGFGTTAILEGLCFGLPAFVLKHNQFEEFLALCEAGMAELYNNAEELAALIRKHDQNVKDKSVQAFWKENAIVNMKREINSIVKNGDKMWKNEE